MKNKSLFIFLSLIFSMVLTADEVEYKTLKVYEPHEVEIACEVFDPPVEIVNGVVQGDITSPTFRIIEARWIKFLQPEIELAAFMDYFFVESEEHTETLTQTFNKIDSNFIDTPFAKFRGFIKIRGIVYFKKEDQEYCYLDMIMPQQANNVTLVNYGIKSEGKWKVYSELPRAVDFGSTLLGSANFIKEAINSVGIIDSEKGGFQIIESLAE